MFDVNRCRPACTARHHCRCVARWFGLTQQNCSLVNPCASARCRSIVGVSAALAMPMPTTLQVLIAAGDSVWVIDADAAVNQGLTAGPLTRLAASPDGRFVAGFSASGRL